MDNFTGTWEYVNGNEKFQIILTKKIKYNSVYNGPTINYNTNYYKDGINIQYKKYTNNILTYVSPLQDSPSLYTKEGLNLTGNIRDYGRITKTVYGPMNILMYQGGGYVQAMCDIEKVSTNPQKVKFYIRLRYEYPNYDYETYAGQPLFSIPDNVIMAKVP